MCHVGIAWRCHVASVPRRIHVARAKNKKIFANFLIILNDFKSKIKLEKI